MHRTFLDDLKELEHLTKHRDELLSDYPVLSINEVPEDFYCGNYLDPNDKSRIIPDGNDCCFWHWLGLPRRWGQRHPMYPWQEQAYEDFFKYDFTYIRKPPKIGGTKLYLRIGMHQSIIDKDWNDGQVAIVVGTRGDEAEKMIERCKEELAYKDTNGVPIRDKNGEPMMKIAINQEYNNKKEFTLNNCEFRAHPAMNVDSIRSQPNMRMILGDEIAFFQMVEQQKARDAWEHYYGGADIRVVLITTAGLSPSGVAYDIETEHPSIYHKVMYDYNIGLVVHPESMTSLYKKDRIDALRGSVSFNRNYLGIWGYGAGNIFDSKTLDVISNEDYPLKDIRNLPNVLSIDPAYGKVRDKLSSKFAGLGMYKENGLIHTRSYFELEEPSDEEALARIRKEIRDYGYKVLVCDGHWTGIINTFTKEMNSYGINYSDNLVNMVDNAQLQTKDLNVRIHPTHEPVLVQLRSIKKNEKGVPDKKQSRFDLGDAYMQGLWHFTGGMTHGRKLSTPF